MEKRKPDMRTQKTKKAIVTAFVRLLREKKYNEITVQDIIKKAEIGRATFYNHYETKDALLSEVQSYVMSEFAEGMAPDEGSSVIPVAKMIRHLEESRFILKSLTSAEADDFFIRHLNFVIRNILKTRSPDSDIPCDLLASYYSTNFIMLLKWQMKNKDRYTPEDAEKMWIKLVKQP